MAVRWLVLMGDGVWVAGCLKICILLPHHSRSLPQGGYCFMYLNQIASRTSRPSPRAFSLIGLAVSRFCFAGYMSTRSKRRAPDRKQQQAEESLFQGRRAKKMDRYQPLHRRGTRSPPPSMMGRPESWRSRGGGEEGRERGRRIDSAGATISPWAEPQGRHSNAYRGGGARGTGHGDSYRGGTRGRSYGDTGRGEPARYIGRESARYESLGQNSANYSSGTPRGRGVPGHARNSQGSFYSYPSTSISSSGGASLQNQFGSVPGYGQRNSSNTRRNDQWRGQNPPPLSVGGYTSSSSRNDYRGGQIQPPPPPPPPPLPPPSMGRFTNPSAPLHTGGRGEPSYLSQQYPESGRPRPEGYRSRESSRGRAPSRDYPSVPPRRDIPHRSEHRYPPLASPYLSSRGPLSSARFRQGIDKHSRYTPTSPSSTFHISEPLNKKPRGRENRAERAAKANPPGHAPTGPSSLPPSLPPIPPPEKKLPIPEPSKIYLAKSLELSTRLPAAAVRRQLIILDLNGTLLVRKCGRARSGSINPTPRPGLAAFLQYIFTNFGVMVWSSAQPDNVHLMVHALFSPVQKKKLLGQWARDTLGLTRAEFSTKVQVYKRLERVWEGEYRISFPEAVEEGENGVWDQTNTMLLDDSPIKALGQPYNHIEVPEFLGTAKELKEDRILVELVGYLEEIRLQGNVSAFIRGEPFKVGGKWKEVGVEVLGEFGWADGTKKVVSEAEDETKVNWGVKDSVADPDEPVNDLSGHGNVGGMAVPDVEGLESDGKARRAKKLKKARRLRKAKKVERKQKAEKSKGAEKLEAIAVPDVEGLEFDQRAEKLEAVDFSDHEGPEVGGDSNQKVEGVASS